MQQIDLSCLKTFVGLLKYKINDMKKMISVLISGVLVTSCGSNSKEKKYDTARGKIYVDLTSFKDSVDFINTAANVKTEKSIKRIMDLSCSRAKFSCSNIATFKPVKLSIYGQDTIFCSLDFMASNTYGTPGEITGLGTFLVKKDTIQCLDFVTIEK